MSDRVARLKATVVDVLPDPVVFRLVPWLYRRQEPELARLDEFVPADRNAVDVGGWLGPWTRELSAVSPTSPASSPSPISRPTCAGSCRSTSPWSRRRCPTPPAASLSLPEDRHGANALRSLKGDIATNGSRPR